MVYPLDDNSSPFHFKAGNKSVTTTTFQREILPLTSAGCETEDVSSLSLSLTFPPSLYFLTVLRLIPVFSLSRCSLLQSFQSHILSGTVFSFLWELSTG